jgi:AAA ATPase domain
LDTLPYAEGTSYDQGKGCLFGTRTEIIDKILAWIKSINRREQAKIYYLYGVAGVGKTSIAHTIARHCDDEGFLMTSFFFDGQVAEKNRPKMLFSTMARNLADMHAGLRRQLVHAIEDTRSLAGATISVHFRELILKTSRSLPDGQPLVMIVDALDEGRADEARQVLQILRDEVPKLPGNFRILLTARLTPDLESYFFRANPNHITRLHLQPSNLTDSDDISIYSRHKLKDVALQKDLGDEWPDPVLFDDFVSRSGGLFIWVSTVYEFLLKSIDPDRRLKSLISTQNPQSDNNWGPEETMNSLYLTILQNCNWKDPEFVHGYPLIMGSIITAKTPLSISALQSLHRNTIPFPIKRFLVHLASLLTGTTDENLNAPVQILHSSLKTFITRGTKDPRNQHIYLDEAEHNQRLAHLCVDLMNEYLPKIISAAGMGYLADIDSEGISQIARDVASEELIYACQFWMDHIITIEEPTQELLDALEMFLLNHFKTWMEIVTAVKQFNAGLSKVMDWIKVW